MPVRLDTLIDFTRASLEHHIKARLVGDPREIEHLEYNPIRLHTVPYGGDEIIFRVKAKRKVALEIGDSESVKDSILDSGVAVLPKRVEQKQIQKQIKSLIELVLGKVVD